MKPANEPTVVARKPLSEKTIAANVLRWGTGGLNIDGCRIGNETIVSLPSNNCNCSIYAQDTYSKHVPIVNITEHVGRFPANVILDEVAGELLDAQSGTLKSGSNCRRTKVGSFSEHGGLGRAGDIQTTYGDSGGASRFFYCAKAAKKERGEGNVHPTVKPLKLMKYLVKLVTPPKGVVLDPFMGPGTTAIACMNTQRNFIGFEMDKGYYDIACKRIEEQKDKVKDGDEK